MAQLSRLALVALVVPVLGSAACISAAPRSLMVSQPRPTVAAPAPATTGWYPVASVPIVEEQRYGSDRLVAAASTPAAEPAPDCSTDRIGEAFLGFDEEEARHSAAVSRAATEEFALLGSAAGVLTQVVRRSAEERGAPRGAFAAFESRAGAAFARIRVALSVAPAGGSPALVEGRRLAEVQGATLDALTAAGEALAAYDSLGVGRTLTITTSLRVVTAKHLDAQSAGATASAALTTHELVSRILAMASRGESPTAALTELVRTGGSSPGLEGLRASLRTYFAHCSQRATLL